MKNETFGQNQAPHHPQVAELKAQDGSNAIENALKSWYSAPLLSDPPSPKFWVSGVNETINILSEYTGLSADEIKIFFEYGRSFNRERFYEYLSSRKTSCEVEFNPTEETITLKINVDDAHAFELELKIKNMRGQREMIRPLGAESTRMIRDARVIKPLTFISKSVDNRVLSDLYKRYEESLSTSYSREQVLLFLQSLLGIESDVAERLLNDPTVHADQDLAQPKYYLSFRGSSLLILGSPNTIVHTEVLLRNLTQEDLDGGIRISDLELDPLGKKSRNLLSFLLESRFNPDQHSYVFRGGDAKTLGYKGPKGLQVGVNRLVAGLRDKYQDLYEIHSSPKNGVPGISFGHKLVAESKGES